MPDLHPDSWATLVETGRWREHITFEADGCWLWQGPLTPHTHQPIWAWTSHGAHRRRRSELVRSRLVGLTNNTAGTTRYDPSCGTTRCVNPSHARDPRIKPDQQPGAVTADPRLDVGGPWWQARTTQDGPHWMWTGRVNTKGVPRAHHTIDGVVYSWSPRLAVAQAHGLEGGAWRTSCGRAACLTIDHLRLVDQHIRQGIRADGTVPEQDRIIPPGTAPAVRDALLGSRIDRLTPVEARDYALARLDAGDTPLQIACDSPRAYAMTGHPWPTDLRYPPLWDSYRRTLRTIT